MDRVVQVKDDPGFITRVKKVAVFGSCLTDAPKINDIDVYVELIWKEDHPEVIGKDRPQAAVDHSCRAEKNGRRFGTLVDRLG
jgi:hypothetical protein